MKQLSQAARDEFFENVKVGEELDIIDKNKTHVGTVTKKTDVVIIVEVKGKPRHFFFKQKIQWS